MKSQKQKPIEVWTNRGICVRNRVFVGGIPKSVSLTILDTAFAMQQSGQSDDVTKVISEIMGFVQLFRTTYMKKVHIKNVF